MVINEVGAENTLYILNFLDQNFEHMAIHDLRVVVDVITMVYVQISPVNTNKKEMYLLFMSNLNKAIDLVVAS